MRTPTPEEFKKLLAQVSHRAPFGGRDRALLILAANTGLRVSELVALDHVHLVDGRGLARRTLQLPSSLAAKNGSERIRPIRSADAFYNAKEESRIVKRFACPI